AGSTTTTVALAVGDSLSYSFKSGTSASAKLTISSTVPFYVGATFSGGTYSGGTLVGTNTGTAPNPLYSTSTYPANQSHPVTAPAAVSWTTSTTGSSLLGGFGGNLSFTPGASGRTATVVLGSSTTTYTLQPGVTITSLSATTTVNGNFQLAGST